MTRRTAKSAAKNAHRGSPRPTTRPKSALGAPMSAMTWEKIDAKMMMSITIDVVRIVAWKASRSVRHVKRRNAAAKNTLTDRPAAASSLRADLPLAFQDPTHRHLKDRHGATCE